MQWNLWSCAVGLIVNTSVYYIDEEAGRKTPTCLPTLRVRAPRLVCFPLVLGFLQASFGVLLSACCPASLAV